MNGEQKIDLSQVSECIKQSSSFGETIFYNICNGSIHHVPWGTADWAFVIVPVILVIAVTIIVWIINL